MNSHAPHFHHALVLVGVSIGLFNCICSLIRGTYSDIITATCLGRCTQVCYFICTPVLCICSLTTYFHNAILVYVSIDKCLNSGTSVNIIAQLWKYILTSVVCKFCTFVHTTYFHDASLIDVSVGNLCLNHGTCIDSANSHSCHCEDGYEGSYCDQDTDECTSSPCNNGKIFIYKIIIFIFGGWYIYTCLIICHLPLNMAMVNVWENYVIVAVFDLL